MKSENLPKRRRPKRLYSLECLSVPKVDPSSVQPRTGPWDEVLEHLPEMLARLDPRERSAVEARFGLGGRRRRLQEVAQSEGCSKQAISQRCQRGLEKLKNWISLHSLAIFKSRKNLCTSK